MIYRHIKKANINASAVGLGGEWLNGLSQDEVKQIFDKAIKSGINYLDLFMPQPEVRSNIGNALKGRREKMIIQGHLCSAMIDGQYERTRDLEKTKFSFEDLLARLETDYIDVGMIHYVDSYDDYLSVFETDIIKYVLELKEKGVIKHIGMSSHNPVIALKAVESGLIDVLMFSINPAYDLEKSDADIYDLIEFKGLDNAGEWNIDTARQMLYVECERMGVGITVMKALGSGSLLKSESSPFKKAMTVNQCIHYCLTRPAVASVLIGVHTEKELDEAIGYLTATDEEKDYSHILSSDNNIKITGKCMYCNHCQPCPSKIDIAMVTKFLDIALIKDDIPDTIKNHYFSLENNADDCIMCGSCESNCPFKVNVRDNMKKAREIFLN